MKGRTSTLTFHQGEALKRIADTYPSILETILEAIQNAIDKNAKRVWVFVNEKERDAFIRDNGYGATQKEFDEALSSVCSSLKRSGKLGQFGIGLITALGKCKLFTFTSCPRGVADEYLAWRFVTNDIVRQRDTVQVPFKRRRDIVFDPKQAGNRVDAVDWRSELAVREYTADKTVGRIDMAELAERIRNRYGKVMATKQVVVHVAILDKNGKRSERDVRAQSQINGTQLPHAEVRNLDVGTVSFNLYRPRLTKGKNKAPLLLGTTGSDYRFNFQHFARVARGVVSDDVLDSLLSGLFGGEIVAQNVKLLRNRQGFERDDAFMGFCLALEEWYQTHGVDQFNLFTESKRHERLQQLGLRSMRNVEGLLADPDHKDLLQVVLSFKHGTVGQGHTRPAHSVVRGKQTDRSLSIDGGTGQGRRKSRKKRKQRRGEPRVDHPGHMPGTVIGPAGIKRTLVKSDSLGLQFCHEPFETEFRLWRLDIETGTLAFNIRHPRWVACEKVDTKLMQFQEFVTILALRLELVESELRLHYEREFEALVSPFVTLLMDHWGRKKKVTPKQRKRRKS